MTTKERNAHKAAIARMCAAANTHDLQVVSDVIDEVVDPDVRYDMPLPVDATGAEAFTRLWATLLTAFPDLRLTIEEMVAEGDTVVARNLVRGTHRGRHLGLSGTGTLLTWQEIFVFRFEGGRVVHVSGVVDLFGQLRQLGLLPAPSRA